MTLANHKSIGSGCGAPVTDCSTGALTSTRSAGVLAGFGQTHAVSRRGRRRSIPARDSQGETPLAGILTAAAVRRGRRAFSLIEILIAVTLMSVIVLGLMATFSETQRAFRTGMTQVDILEAGRSALELMAREIEQAEATDMSNSISFYVGPNPYGPAPAVIRPYRLDQDMPGTNLKRINIFQDVLFLSREAQEWTAIGYAVVYTNYIGTLYRYQTNASAVDYDAPYLASIGFNNFYSANPNLVSPNKVVEGVVHLKVDTYDSYGRLLSPNWNYKVLPNTLVDISAGPRGTDINCTFYSNALPAYVDIELGILESKTAERARAIGEDSLNAQKLYLEKQVGKVQVFRQRIPIRNVDPSVYQ